MTDKWLEEGDIHWAYFLTLEEDLHRLSRFVEISEGNFATHSIECTRLLLASCSEAEVVLKLAAGLGHGKYLKDCLVSLGEEAIALGQLLVDRYQCVVMVAIHEPVGGSDTRNHHTHLLMSSRKVGPEGLGERAGLAFDARGGKGAEEVRAVRELVGALINAHLARAGIEEAVDHRSLKDQAKAAVARGDHQSAIRLTRPPTKHVGKVGTHASREAAVSEMDQAIAAAAARGALVATPDQHSHGSAMADRIAARRANPLQKPPIVWGRLARPRQAGSPVTPPCGLAGWGGSRGHRVATGRTS